MNIINNLDIPDNNLETFNYIFNIYKICCKDINLCPDFYIGRTQNLFTRFGVHISYSKNSELKLYKKIRETGGWVNWTMVKIATGLCADRFEAKQIEQYFCNLLNPTLNSIRAHVGSIDMDMLQKKFNLSIINDVTEIIEISNDNSIIDETINISNMHSCEFCLSMFCNKQSLKKHQKEEKKFECLECKDMFATKQTLATHVTCCKVIKQKNLIGKDDEIKRLTNLLEQKNNEILELRTKLDIYYQNSFKEIPKRKKVKTIEKAEKKISNNNLTNKYNYLTKLKLTDEIIKRTVEEDFTEKYFIEGQKGVAMFTYNNLLLDEENNLKYVCGDVNRYLFYYKNDDETIQKDVKAINLTQMISEYVIQKSQSILMKFTDNESYQNCFTAF